MKNSEKALAGLIVAVLALPAAARPVDYNDPEALPIEGLAKYGGYREPLLRKGWQPIPDRNAYADGFPEVVCGNAFCTADWKSPAGREVSFTLWQRYEDEERLVLYLAPQFDDVAERTAE